MKTLKIISIVIGSVAAVCSILAAIGLLTLNKELKCLDFSTDFSLED